MAPPVLWAGISCVRFQEYTPKMTTQTPADNAGTSPALKPTAPPSATDYDHPARKEGARAFLVESAVGSTPVSVHGQFTHPFIIKMGATSSHMALLAAMSEAFSIASQLVAPWLTRATGGRKRMVVVSTLAAAVPWAGLIAVPFLPDGIRVWAALIMISLTLTVALIGDAPWGSWVSDLVPPGRRGRWMGRRGTIALVVYVGIGLVGAFTLDGLGEAVKWGFAVAFAAALVARVASAFIFSRVADPRPDLKMTPMPPPWKLATMVKGNPRLGRFYAYMLAIHFAIFFAAPFFGIYMLNDLGMSYTAYVAAGVVNSLAQMVAMQFWGRVADRKGNYFVLAVCGVTFSLWPIVFIAVPAIWYVFVANIAMGLASAGWALCQYNFVLENCSDEDRPRSVAFYRIVVSVGSVTGSLVAAILAPRVPELLTYQIMTMFIISSALRGAATLALLPRFRGKALAA
ncbi:MAG: MFS transporter [SAR202 cluster bacterium]|nr:MFS transporter [SAR202 cluster bacterium]